MDKKIIQEVYEMLKNRDINPSGTFDKAGRFYLDNSELVDVRKPSRAHPYSQMLSGRTRKYVKAVAEHFNCKDKKDLIDHV